MIRPSRHHFLLILLMSMTFYNSFAYDLAVKNADGVTIYYNYINNRNELEVTWNGVYTTSEPIVIPEEVTYMNNTWKVTSIGDFAFNYSSTTSIIIPNSIKNIGEAAFQLCRGLTSIIIPYGVTSIKDNAFYGCDNLISITIPNSVTSIGKRAFYCCESLTSATIPNSVTNIGDQAFYLNKNLTSISIGDGVTTIGESAFGSCKSLTSVTIGKNVKTIQDYAFYNSKVSIIISKIENPFEITWKQFDYYSFANATLYVPIGTIDKYKAKAGWKDFKHIEEVDSNNEEEVDCEFVGVWKFLWSTPFSSFIMTQVEFKSDGTFSYTSTDDANYEEHGVYKIEGDILYQKFSNEDDWELSRIKSVDSNYLKLIDLSDDGLRELRELDFLRNSVDNYNLSLIGTWLGNFPYNAKNRYKQWTFNSDGTGYLTEWHDDSDKKTKEMFKYTVSGASITIDWGDGSPEEYEYSISGVTLTLSRFEISRNYYWQGEVTGIRSVVSMNLTDRIYSLSGAKQNTPSKGINIIKMKNGTTKKVLIK